MRRLERAPRASSFDEALRQLSDILNTVEDEMTDIPYNPDARQPDGRLYPPRADSIREVPGHPRVRRLRSRAHNTFIGENGSIEIADSASGVPPTATLFKKAGADGRTAWGQAE
jgi:hypothetical protein